MDSLYHIAHSELIMFSDLRVLFKYYSRKEKTSRRLFIRLVEDMINESLNL